MNIEDFKKHGYEIVDWIAEYFENVENYPVKARTQPGDIYKQLPKTPPLKGESFKQIMDDFNKTIIPGITHWQSPNFFAYFNANNSFPSILGEFLTSALGVNVFSWETSPAGTELEQIVMEWLGQMIGLPEYFSGVIQDTASTATLVALITAREKKTNYQINKKGNIDNLKFRVYCSSEAHSSIEKGVKIAGIGSENLIKISLNEDFSMNYNDLKSQIINDKKAGYTPVMVVSAVGTTGSTAVDNVFEIAEICKEFDIWHHVDAAHLGSALLLEENRLWIRGIEGVDSFVFNPHKWLFTNFDFSAYFVKDKSALIRTFEIMPEYLKTTADSQVNNYRDWGIQLGRRFRALKMWFVIRTFGVDELKNKIRFHIQLTKDLEVIMKSNPKFEFLAPVIANLICFRFHPENINDEDLLNEINIQLIEKINSDGKIYLTKTKLNGKITLRIVIGQTNISENNVNKAWNIICENAEEYLNYKP
jgi:aromatic-L-amino-acid decarboxylase